MDDCKYVVFEYVNAMGMTMETIFVFPLWITHKEFARQMDQKVLSAGFVSSNGTCYGRSTSLGVMADRERDTYLYNKMRNKK